MVLKSIMKMGLICLLGLSIIGCGGGESEKKQEGNMPSISAADKADDSKQAAPSDDQGVKDEKSTASTATTESAPTADKKETAQKDVVQKKAAAPKDEGMKPLPIVLPKPMFIGTPENLQVPNLQKPLGKPRPPFLAPSGTKNVAAGKLFTSSDSEPIIGEISMLNDDDKEATDGSYVELGPFQQYVTVDLEKAHTIYAVLLWHFHKQPRVYFDVVVQIADDADFITNVRTIFNNDHDNSSGFGVGGEMHYVETSEGKLIDAKGAKARFVRFYSNGNNSNDLNHYVEAAVYGKPVE